MTPLYAQFAGDTTNGDIFIRPGSGIPPTTLGDYPTRYQVRPFRVPTTGMYDVVANYTTMDGFLAIYQNSFDPYGPLTNCIGADDDHPSLGTTASELLGLSLTAGTTYYILICGYDGDEFGAWTASFTPSTAVADKVRSDPEIQVLQAPGVEIFHACRTNLGTILAGGHQRTFTIRNAGTAATLTLGTVSATNESNCSVTITQPLSASLAPGVSTTFHVQIDANNPGGFFFDINIPSSDTDEAAWYTSVSGVAVGSVSNLPYFENFEDGSGGWGAAYRFVGSSWALGTPAGTSISSAASGTQAWVTNLSGNYLDNEISSLNSPRFNFSGLTADPYIRFAINYDSESGYDGLVLQASTDGGFTWQAVGAYGDPNNWYNESALDYMYAYADGGDAWADGSGGWVVATRQLTGLAGQANVLLRFQFVSDGSVNYEGFGIDDVWVGAALPGVVVEEPAGQFVPNGKNFTLYGLVVGGTSIGGTFTIRNIGSADVDITAISASMTNGTVSVTPATTPPWTLMADQFDTFDLDIDPNVAAGPFNGTVTITTNTGNYVFTFSGTIQSTAQPVIQIEAPLGTAVANGGNVIVTNTGVQTLSRDFWILNAGAAALNITGVTVTGQNNCTANITVTAASTLSAADGDRTGTMFRVTVTPLAAGAFGFVATITSNSSTNGTYVINFLGNTAGGGGGGGKKKDSGGGCSAGQGGANLLALAAALAGLAVALRLRRARA
ncbi:MAG: choice-of-anchor D domain-containing protein [Planctomycetes bacterium]|nr:choice-of-anchor D domain-containing protein [Planctomycetota bacterium]MCL4729166.1 choice-of-anchor D domain-containing protein [Planctomycetota bacterium]